MFRLFVLLVLALPVTAQTVYKTVEDGVTTFSDSPPSDGDADIVTLDVPPAADAALVEERLAAMRETTERMAAERRAREKHRAELRALKATTTPEPETLVREQPVVSFWTGSYWPAYRYRRSQPPFRPYRSRPAILPVAESPPGWSVIKPGNAQLMRPRVYQRR